MKRLSTIRTWQLIALSAGQALNTQAYAKPAQTDPGLPSLSLAAPSALSWQPQRGSEHAYHLQYRGTAKVDYSLVASAMTRSLGTAKVNTAPEVSRVDDLGYDIDAILHTKVISVDAGGWAISARLHDVRYLVDGQPDARVELFQTPFIAHFDSAGHMTSVEFMRKYPEALKRALSRLIEPLQVVFGAPGEAKWATREQGADTTYAATYDVSNQADGIATLTKTKTSISHSALDTTELTLPGVKDARIGHSSTTIAFNLKTHSPSSIESSESTSLHLGGRVFTAESHTFTATEVAAPTSAPLAMTLPAARAQLADPAFARARMYDVDLRTQSLVDGLSLPAATKAFKVNVASNMGMGTRVLQAWTRLNPGQSLLVAKTIDALNPREDERAFGFGWAALASAGHREAQAALVQVATGIGSWKAESREQALVAMMSLDLPEPTTETAVWALRQSLASAQVGSNLSLATNVYGSLGDVSKGSPALTATVVHNLTGVLSSGDESQQVLALDALSNVGEEASVAPLAAPFLASKNERVRIAAFSAYRRMGPSILPAFADAFAKETSAEVRLAAARTAGQMADSEELSAWARTRVSVEPDVAVQRELVHVLGHGIAQHSSNADTLRALLTTTTERRVRRDIFTYVAPTSGAR
jgi:HEAT repeat protein